jgi:fatty-acyl-CoA synthase
LPREVERALAEHPAVDQVAVVSMPDDKWGEVGCAFVVLKPGTKVTEEALLEFLRTKLARYKVPKKAVFLSALPLTSAGKTDKRALQETAKKGI